MWLEDSTIRTKVCGWKCKLFKSISVNYRRKKSVKMISIQYQLSINNGKKKWLFGKFLGPKICVASITEWKGEGSCNIWINNHVNNLKLLKTETPQFQEAKEIPTTGIINQLSSS